MLIVKFSECCKINRLEVLVRSKCCWNEGTKSSGLERWVTNTICETDYKELEIVLSITLKVR